MTARAGALALVLTLALVAGPGCRVEERAGGGSGGTPAPAFELEDLEGNPVSLESFRGRPVVLDFWATWCAPCVFQIPILNAFHEAEGERVAVLGVAVDVDGREVVAPFAAEQGIEYPVLLGSPELAQRYQAPGFPSLYVIAPDGTIDFSHVGIIDRDELEQAVASARARPAGTSPH